VSFILGGGNEIVSRSVDYRLLPGAEILANSKFDTSSGQDWREAKLSKTSNEIQLPQLQVLEHSLGLKWRNTED
jgi:hypothetical protein